MIALPLSYVLIIAHTITVMYNWFFNNTLGWSPATCAVREKTILKENQLQELLDKLVEKEQYDKAFMLSLAMKNGRPKAELPRMKVSYFTEDKLHRDV